MDRIPLSVIVPVYNAEDYLDETLDSIESQSLTDIQIICVDDCSSDGSFIKLEEHAACDGRITVVHHDTNKGAGAAINSGLALAQGDYIQIVGNDDLLTEGALQRIIELCLRDQLDLLMYGISTLSDDPDDPVLQKRAKVQERYHKVEHSYPVTTGTDLLKLMVENREYRMTNGPMCIKRKLLGSQIRNIEGVLHEDMYFSYRLLLSSRRTTLTSEVFYQYRIRKGSQEYRKNTEPVLAIEPISLITSAYAMLRDTPVELLNDEEFAPVVDSLIYSHVRRCISLYSKLTDTERVRFASCLAPEVRTCLPLLENERKVRQSMAFRVGTTLAYLPRKLRELSKRRSVN